MLRSIATLTLALLLTSEALASCSTQKWSSRPWPESPPWSKTDCPEDCVVKHSPGGLIYQFEKAAIQIKSDGRRLVIDGECISACTVAADKARPAVCITANAVFGFHKAYSENDAGDVERVDMANQYSFDVRTWVRQHGGFPGKDACDDTLLIMDFSQARRFFPVCGGEH